jgi:hypothetical protein
VMAATATFTKFSNSVVVLDNAAYHCIQGLKLLISHSASTDKGQCWSVRLKTIAGGRFICRRET